MYLPLTFLGKGELNYHIGFHFITCAIYFAANVAWGSS